MVEEYLRFALEDHPWAAECKQLRHDLVQSLSVLPVSRLHAVRDVDHDVGTSIKTAAEYQRTDLAAVAAANWSRVEQAVRSLEEYVKVLGPALAPALEAIRYRVYALERSTTVLRESRRRLESAMLYVLLDGRGSLSEFQRTVGQLLAGPVDVVQLRDKNLSDRALLERARALREMTRRQGVLFIMNDRVDLAVLASADGVHLGQDDLTVKDARMWMGVDALIGVSTHSIAQARQAVLDGASYLGCGPTFASSTKQFDSFPGLTLLREVVREIRLPAFAIGGMDSTNVQQVCDAGMLRVAVCGGVVNAPDPAEAARRIRGVLLDAQRAADASAGDGE